MSEPLHVLSHASGTPTATPNPHFARIGGADAIARLVDRFYLHMDGLPQSQVIRRMHPAELQETKRVLRLYLGEWMGGPALYSAERGHPRLRMRHGRFAIGPEARDAWMTCMRLALDEVVGDRGLRAELEDKLRKLADFLEDQPNASMGPTPTGHG